MSDISKPATLDEIAKVMGKGKRTVELAAKKSDWKYTEEVISGKNNKRLYALKDLPQDIQYAVQRKRRDDDLTIFTREQEKQYAEFNTTSTQLNPRTAAGIRRNNEISKPISISDNAVNAEASREYGVISARKPGVREHAADEGAATGVGATGDGLDLAGRWELVSDRRRGISNEHANGGIAPLDPGNDLSRYTEGQRDTGLAIQTVMRWIDKHPRKKAAALRELNQGYKDNTLPSPLKSALERCKQKSSGKAKTTDILTPSTVTKWQARFKEQGNYIPQVRQKDMTIKPWHVDLMPMLSKNRQKRCYTLIHEQLLITHPNLGYDVMTRWIREKYDRMDVIKGRHTGMQLRAKQSYQPRTSNGMEPWQEVHADGWNTHFTAPHPITGEFVTYELWDFHDVATRYIPPFGIGLTECFEVIAKGIENCIRDNGVMCILQTDSTKIIKNNAKFTGDPVKSISDKAGFTIVHPVTVGNAQANGISENWHTWADKQCRALATYQAGGQDSLTLRNVKKITAQMVKAADKGEIALRDKLKAQAEKIGGGIVFGSYYEAIDWMEVNLRQKWNNKPHRALPKVSDSETGKMRHQTPQECMDMHKANGWTPVMLDESILADLFLVHVELKVSRGMVKPYGGMLFRAPELGAYEGDRVVVAYDSMDYSQVWVKDLKGELICVAPFLEPTGYRSLTAYEAAQEKRAVAQINNREKQIIQIKKRAGIDEGGNIIEGEVLERVAIIPAEPVEPLKRIVVEGGFNKQEPEQRAMNYHETVQMLKAAKEYPASQ